MSIKFENTVFPSPEQWRSAIMGARNPLNSWERSDSEFDANLADDVKMGPNDLDLLIRLRNAGTDHRKFMRMLPVHVTITAPLYWWKEMDQYRVGQTTNSCSTMHKIHAKEFTLEDFSFENIDPFYEEQLVGLIRSLNQERDRYNDLTNKKRRQAWYTMIQMLPSSYNQKRTVMLNYEVLANIYKSRKHHKLDEWSVGFMDWIKSLPYSELITGKEGS